MLSGIKDSEGLENKLKQTKQERISSEIAQLFILVLWYKCRKA